MQLAKPGWCFTLLNATRRDIIIPIHERRSSSKFTVEPNGPNRLDIVLSGKLDSEQMKAALDDLVGKAKDIQNGRMLYRIDDFALPTLGAIGVEMSRLPELFKLIGKFDRTAVLAKKKWIQSASELEGALIPGLKIKAFGLDEEADAEAWLESYPE